MKNKTIILAGSGHAHLEVIKLFSRQEIAEHRFILISPERLTYYSGLLPRLIMGAIEVSDLVINSAALAEAKGFRFIQDSVLAVDMEKKLVQLASGMTERFDLLSLNVGGEPLSIPSESPEQTIYLRPFEEMMSRWNKLQEQLQRNENPRLVLIGGGAAGVEVATALRVRLNTTHAGKGEVHLVAKGDRLCESYSEKISMAILHSLTDLKVQVHLQEPIQQIFANYLKLKSGAKLAFDDIFVVTPTEPSQIISGQINLQLQVSPHIFAVGDATTMKGHPQLPRSGVIAVRQGRHLARSIRQVLKGQPIQEFTVPARQLNILMTGEHSARIVWGSFSFEGRLPLQLKNWIDRKYIQKLR